MVVLMQTLTMSAAAAPTNNKRVNNRDELTAIPMWRIPKIQLPAGVVDQFYF
jgi:hypothetical protein